MMFCSSKQFSYQTSNSDNTLTESYWLLALQMLHTFLCLFLFTKLLLSEQRSHFLHVINEDFKVKAEAEIVYSLNYRVIIDYVDKC
jgi:hypothetical protein